MSVWMKSSTARYQDRIRNSKKPGGYALQRHFLPETLGLRINLAEEEAHAMVSAICEEPARGIRRRIVP